MSAMAARIVLAEDEPNIVVSLRYLLSRAGYDVTAYENGQAALDAIMRDPPDLAILDVMLPGIDGFEILRNLRAGRSTDKLPVLMLTAKGQREDRERALAAGADMFVTKPFSNSELLEAVADLAGGTAP